MGCLIVWFRRDLGLCSLSGCGLGLAVGGLPLLSVVWVLVVLVVGALRLSSGDWGVWVLAGLVVGCGTCLRVVFRCGIALPIVVWWFGGFVWFRGF